MSGRAAAVARPSLDSDALSRYFRVLGDPTRLLIVEALLQRERTVSELVDLLGAPQSRISNHLACLRWCRFVESERRGRTVVYRITDGRARQLLELAASLAEPNCDHLASCQRIGPDWI
ncbi:MAG: metalloregulator ArsR/SmtB family transcription factor [Actinomycetota bacterium]